MQIQEKIYHLGFKVIHGDQRPLLYGAMCQELGLIKMDIVNAVQSPDIIDQYRDVFECLGFLDKEYHIEMDPAVSPSQQAPRRVPVALKEQIKEKLQKRHYTTSYRVYSMDQQLGSD